MKSILNSTLGYRQSTRHVHFHPDVAQCSNNRRAPLEKLQYIKSFIENGILADCAIELKIQPEKNIGASSTNSSSFTKRLSFPATSEREAVRFTMYIRLISLLIENLKRNVVTTKRDLYYQDVSLFQNQGNVNTIIEDICRALGFTNQELGAVATQKGLCYGDVTFENGNTSQIFTKQQGSFLIPRLNNKMKIKITSDIEYILVVEKEAVFNLLCDPNVKRIIITGKGFPDVLSRRFLSLLSSTHSSVPVLGIADIDPYGLNIMKQFKSGGDKSNCYLVNRDQEFDCPRLKLVGISILDFLKYLDCLDLSIRDFMISSKMLESEFHKGDDEENEIWRSNLQRSMFFLKKAEIDIVKGSTEDEDISLYISQAILKKLNR